jgi:hypothetical protein
LVIIDDMSFPSRYADALRGMFGPPFRVGHVAILSVVPGFGPVTPTRHGLHRYQGTRSSNALLITKVTMLGI